MRIARIRVKTHQVRKKPTHEKLPWPGLHSTDHLSRVVTRAVKEDMETRETHLWAEEQIARVLDQVSADTAISLILREMKPRGTSITQLTNSLFKAIPRLPSKAHARRDRV
jgi:hypothetical protein